MQNGGETPASRPRGGIRSDARPTGRGRGTGRISGVEPRTFHSRSRLSHRRGTIRQSVYSSKFREPSRTTKFSWTATLNSRNSGNDGHPWSEAGADRLSVPVFHQKHIPRRHAFNDRLLPFLQKLPSDHQFAVEIRNRDWLNAEFATCCVITEWRWYFKIACGCRVHPNSGSIQSPPTGPHPMAWRPQERRRADSDVGQDPPTRQRIANHHRLWSNREIEKARKVLAGTKLRRKSRNEPL